MSPICLKTEAKHTFISFVYSVLNLHNGPSPSYCTVEPTFKIPLDEVQAFYTLNSEKSQKVSCVRIKQKVAAVGKKNMYSL